jgi:hypothetical protein
MRGLVELIEWKSKGDRRDATAYIFILETKEAGALLAQNIDEVRGNQAGMGMFVNGYRLNNFMTEETNGDVFEQGLASVMSIFSP